MLCEKYNYRESCTKYNYNIMSNSLEIFSKGVASYLVHQILPEIVKGLAEKEVHVTVEELLEMTKVPAEKNDTLPPPAILPSLKKGGKLPGMTASVTARSASGSDEAPLKPTCQYKFVRASNGSSPYCGKTVANGSEYCSAHKNRGPKSASLEKAKISPGVAKDVISSLIDEQKVEDTAPLEMKVSNFCSKRGLVKMPQLGWIIRTSDNGVIGKLDDSTKEIVPLTPAEKEKALNMGLAVHELNSEPAVVAEFSETTPSETAREGVTIRKIEKIPAIPSVFSK